ncbi:MAG: hypothetical protein J5I47_06750 [Vicingus serpentipes]|nr:hypothetical protein [Vicingus serpentipes]
MKKILILLIVLFTFSLTYSQSVFRKTHADGASPVSVSQLPLSNVWYGSQFSYKLTGDDNFNENFLFNANVIYNINFDSGSWNLPIAGNVMLPTSGGSFEDIQIGLYPWKIISKPGANTVTVLHGGVAYSIDPENESGLSPQKIRLFAGIELSFPLGTNALPLSISLTPFYEGLNLSRDDLYGLEGTFVLPIAANLGVIGELKFPFVKDVDSSFSAGVIINGALN